MFKTSNTTEVEATAIRSLAPHEVDTVAGGKVIAVIVLGGCTDPIQWGPRHPRVIIFNPWINPGTPERSGTGTTF